MDIAPQLTFYGLGLTLFGAALLFFYGLPTKKIGNVVLWGITAMKYSDPEEPDVPEDQWQAAANKFQRRAKALNRSGFALIAMGTALQMIAVCL
jgi:hypothetical protein